MDRYAIKNLFGIQGFYIAWYGIIIVFGMLLGICLAVYRGRKLGIKSDDIWDLALWMLPGCILCARLYYVIFEWQHYRAELLGIFAIRQGGLAIYGGVIGGILIAFFFCRKRKISFLTLADVTMPSLVLGQAIGRWGNFVNQEAFGGVIANPKLQFFPFAVYIDKLQEWHQATFFYESSLNVILLIFMLALSPKLQRRGYLLPVYLIGYGTIRAFVEGMRSDSLYILPGIRVSQLLSLCLILTGCAIAVWLCRKEPRKEHENGM